MSEVEKKERIDRLFNDHEVRLRIVKTAVVKLADGQADLRQVIAKIQTGLTFIQTGLAIFGALWLWVYVRPLLGGVSAFAPAHHRSRGSHIGRLGPSQRKRYRLEADRVPHRPTYRVDRCHG